MPWADHEKNKAAVRSWNRRNRASINAAKRRHRARAAALRAAVRVVRPLSDPRWSTATPEQRRYYYKLRRGGVRKAEARRLAWGQDDRNGRL